MGAETVRVDPAEVGAAGSSVSKVGRALGGEFGTADDAGIRPDKPLRETLRSATAARTLATLWSNYLENLGKNVDAYGDRLALTAKAYRDRDEEAAEALGVDLPDERYQRPGRPTR